MLQLHWYQILLITGKLVLLTLILQDVARIVIQPVKNTLDFNLNVYNSEKAT